MCGHFHALNTFTLIRSPFQYPVIRDYLEVREVLDVVVKKKCPPLV
jgi:hypothetical protein